MEVKKIPKANLENRKFLFITMGVVFSLSLLLVSLEWTQNLLKAKAMNVAVATIEDEGIAPTPRTEPKSPPPPPPQIINPIIVVGTETPVDVPLVFTTEGNQGDPVGPARSVGSAPGEEVPVDNTPFVIVETMPKFNGNVLTWVAKNLKYPPIAAENGIQGRVFVQFVIERDGSVSNVRVTRGVDPSLDKEAIRVVQSMPKWTPGEQRQKKVRVSYCVPISFVLK